jgi:hypothetical protein
MLKFLFRALLVAAVLVIAVWAIRSFTGFSGPERAQARPARVQIQAVAPLTASSTPPAAAPVSSEPPSGLPAAPIPYDQLKNGQTQAPPPAEQTQQDKNTIFY